RRAPAATGATATADGPAGAAAGAATSPRELTTDVLSAADQARIDQQRPLVAAASKIRWEIERHPYAGYTGIELEDAQVALWWKGALPPRMATVVRAASAIAPVRVRAAAHSLAELRAAAARVREAQPQVDSIKFQVDGSGLVVGTHTDKAGAADKAGAGKAGAAEAASGTAASGTAGSALSASALSASAGAVPVTVVREDPMRPVSRDDDWAPWKGGATIVDATRSTACTAGFGVRSGGASYILTAGHCGQVGDRIQDARGEFIGNVGPRQQAHDVELIPTSSVDGYVYIGTPTDNVVGLVQGWDWTFVGELLCQSGVTSSRELGRPVCNLKVLFYYDDEEDLVEAEQTEGQTAARPGDSGGPIYSVAASGKLIAKGTTTRVAGARIGFQDYGTAWRDFGGITPATR
ncbi:hypothetical protein, partial [Mangrovihabitans endophyticus]|uniref:hypothetical protein n=1 Tax=Mangrovihabitans endophyticus TaxID=1751298 RepID=UPI0016668ACC